MALISKKTFREWARVLTARGLTLENAELFAESGNTITVRQRRRRVGIFTIDELARTITWRIGCAWLDGGSVPWEGSLLPGTEIVKLFDPADHRQQRIYCRLDFRHVSVINESIVSGTPDVVTQFWTTVRAEPNAGGGGGGDASFEVGFVEDETATFLSEAASINTATNVGTVGIRRIPVASITWIPADPPLVPYGFWQVESYGGENAGGLIIFNIADYSDGRIWPTINSLELV